VLHSASRLFTAVTEADHRSAAARLRELLDAYSNSEDLIKIGAYQQGTSALIDEAIQRHEGFNSFLRQDRDCRVGLGSSIEELMVVSGVEGTK
jgi:flagellum-specific ATP synthase